MIDIVMLSQKVVVTGNFATGFRIFKVGIKAHRCSAVGGEFGHGDADASAFVFAEGERFVVECAANVTSLQGGLAENAGGEVAGVCRATGAVPEIILVAAPEIGGQQATFVA